MATTPGNGINKNLLTPCRRVGLSRKRKTPNSIVRISSDYLNSTNASIHDSPVIDTTPVNHRKCFSRRKPESFQEPHSSSSPLAILPINSESNQLKTKLETLQECDDNNKSKRGLLGKFSSEDLFDPTNDTETSKKTFKDNPMDQLKNTFAKNELINNKYSIDEREGSPLACSLEVIKAKISRKSMRRLSDDDFLSFEKTSVQNDTSNKPKEISSFNLENDVIDESDEDFNIVSKFDSKTKRKQQNTEENKNTKKTKRVKKTLSMKKSFIDDEFVDTDISKKDNDVKECLVQIQRLSEDSIYLSETSANIADKPLQKLVRKGTVTVVDDDDDAFTFTPEQEKTEKKNLLKKIRMLEDQIRLKQQKFANLKQASIYKHKHDVEGLKQLTSQWVNGCVLGLNDLLEQLQAHGPMSMTTLINNLHISSELVAKLPLNIK